MIKSNIISYKTKNLAVVQMERKKKSFNKNLIFSWLKRMRKKIQKKKDLQELQVQLIQFKLLKF